MYLVLCSATDASALWAYEGLKHLGLAPVELVLSEALAHGGTRWEHRLDRTGAHIKLALPDGRVICGSRIRGAINRLTGPPPMIALQAADSDREYAQAELQAFYLSWLNALPGTVLNRPAPSGLCGAWHHGSEWSMLAGRAGLSVRPYRQSASDAPEQFYMPQAPPGVVPCSFIAFAGEVFGQDLYGVQLPEPVVRACGRLALEAKAQVMGIDLYLDSHVLIPGGRWNFASATPSPDLRIGGLPLLRRMAQELVEGGRA